MNSLEHIVGQQRALRALKRAIETGRIAGAYLFGGPPGVGKCSTARALAGALNCRRRPGVGCADGSRCGPCDKVARGIHPDLTVLEPEGQYIKIDQVRALHQQLIYPPHEGRHRLVVIDGADRLNLNAANALLKAVEEPRPDTLFVLVSSAAHKVIPTLLSRCQIVRFQPLTRDAVAEVVARHSPAEQDLRATAVAVAEGSPGRALRLLDSEQLAVARRIMASLLETTSAPDATTVFRAAEEAGREREPVLDALELLRVWLRDLMLLHEGADRGRLIHVDQLPRLEEEARRSDRAAVLRRLRALQQAQAALLGNANPRLTLEQLAFQLR